MKQYISLFLIVILLLSCSACGSQTHTPPLSSDVAGFSHSEPTELSTTPIDNNISIGNFTFELGDQMTYTVEEDNVFTITLIPDKAALVAVYLDVSMYDTDMLDLMVQMQHDLMVEGKGTNCKKEPVELDICGFPAKGEGYGEVKPNGALAAYIDFTFTDTYYAYTFQYLGAPSDSEEATDLGFACGEFMRTAKYNGPEPRQYKSESTNNSPEDVQEEKTHETTSISAGERNALHTAKQYLQVSAFSYDGLIDQLEFEGYTNSEAIYAVDNCGADWTAQALKKAKDYLRTSAFSYNGLVEQLIFEGFTDNQAQYGANNSGADWNEQAVKKAKQYLSISSFSRDNLISQLQFEGFTYEQAVYGVDETYK